MDIKSKTPKEFQTPRLKAYSLHIHSTLLPQNGPIVEPVWTLYRGYARICMIRLFLLNRSIFHMKIKSILVNNKGNGLKTLTRVQITSRNKTIQINM